MKSALRVVCVLLMVLAIPAFIFANGGRDKAEERPVKIAFFVSDLSNVFHQAQYAEAKACGMSLCVADEVTRTRIEYQIIRQ